MERHYAIISTPVGRVPFLGATMSPEREKELQTAVALRSMPSFGLEPVKSNLTRYYQLVQEVLA